MKKFLTLFVVTLLCLSVVAQTKKTKTSSPKAKATWTRGFHVALYAGQAGSKNWASGSEPFSLAGNVFLNGFINRSAGRWSWNNNFIASFGMVNNKEQGFRKNDDKLDYYSTIGRNFKKNQRLALASAFNFRSQFWKGYDHDYLNQGIKRRTSGFFAPAYITVAPIGIQYTVLKSTMKEGKGKKLTATDKFQAFLGLGGRGVIVSNSPYSYVYQGGVIPANLVNDKNPATQERSVAEMYGVDPERTIRYEIGPYFAATYNKEIVKNVTLMGRFDAFSDFHNGHPERIDLFFTNTFSLRVNKWLSAIYSLDLAYDHDTKKFGAFKDKTGNQVKSILGVGINANIK